MNSLKKFIKWILQLRKEEKYVPIEHLVTKDKQFENHIALITGGSGGIGLCIAKKLLSSRCKVIIAGTNQGKLDKIVNELINEGYDKNFISSIVIEYNSVDTFDDKINEASQVFGNIDIFISCTGIHVDRDGLDFLNVTEDEYDRIMSVNLKGTYFMCQSISKRMISNNVKGHILIISSQSALEPSWSPYRLSKLGISGITKGLAQRLLEHGIIVNSIGPGPTATTMQKNYHGKYIYTPLNPLKRYTMPEEVAEVAAMMVSHTGDTIIGDTIYMSGGRGIVDIR